MENCAGCGHAFKATDTRCDSSVYQAHDVELCEKCWEAEEGLINREGTNDLPNLLASYNANKRE